MSVSLLPAPLADSLRAAPFTYPEVGATADGPQAGYGWLERRAVLRRRDFDAAALDLLSWRLQAASGLRVQTSEVPMVAGTVVLMRIGPGRASLEIPCRVVHTVEEPDRRGFAYGTLPGHPEVGEERFVLTRRTDGSLELVITAFSRPGTRLARLGGPVSRRLQHEMTTRYLRALDE